MKGKQLRIPYGFKLQLTPKDNTDQRYTYILLLSLRLNWTYLSLTFWQTSQLNIPTNYWTLKLSRMRIITVCKKQQQRTLTEYTMLPCVFFNSCNAVLLNVSRKPLEVNGHISMSQLFFQCQNLICVFLKDKVGYPLRKQFSHQWRKLFL